MANYNQAPVLLAIGEKNKNQQFAYRPHELEYAICCCLGNRDIVTLKTMLFFTGESNNGDFRVAQKTIMERMNISEKTYYKARKQLEEMGWIHYDDKANAIYINYEKIYSDYKAYKKMNAGGSHSSSIRVSMYNSPDLKEIQEIPSDDVESSHDDSQQDCLQDRYNNINNSINNTIRNKITSGGAVAAKAASPLTQEEGKKALKALNEKYDLKFEKLAEKYGRDMGKTKEFDKLYKEKVSEESRIRRIYGIPKDPYYY